MERGRAMLVRTFLALWGVATVILSPSAYGLAENSPEEKLYGGLDQLLKAYNEDKDVAAKLKAMSLKHDPSRLPIMIITEGEASQYEGVLIRMGVDLAWVKGERITANASIRMIERIANRPWVRYILLAQPPVPEEFITEPISPKEK